MSHHKPYQGHRNYNAWNVCLYLMNEEPWYRLAQWCVGHCRSREAAARAMLAQLPEKTPDGVPFTYTNVRLALRNWCG